MSDLKDDLRDYFDVLASAAERNVPRVPLGRRSRRPLLLAAAAAAVVGLIAGGLMLREGGTDSDGRLVAGQDGNHLGGTTTPGGPDRGVVLDLVGLTVGEARPLVAERGFQLFVNQGDPDFETAIVLAVEPPVEEHLPAGTVIGARTVLRDPPVSVECANTRHPRFGGSGDGLPHASQITRQFVETELAQVRGSGQFPGALYIGEWNRFANMIDGQASIERHDGYQIIAVLDHEADCPDTITFAGGPPITFVTVSPDEWPGS